MIVCSCACVSDRDIHAAIDWMRAADRDTVITPGKIYRALGKAPTCGGCIRLFVANMRANARLQAGARPEVPPELRSLRVAGGEDG